ncbi:LamB/YcsF family protein [Oceanicola sp. D3]|uniref:LamB/YcsF family protein n=1 Tax=Oceanicola sp. D3 TaxID=2587163 RepID=UPI001123F0A9|nr:5-oxoprolinase subunit PxpA [Oceanicola sp. D3]QDC11235.1 LamB/YcsF family protein [Oceanicola sp. D3]
MSRKIDLNADMGESFGPWVMGQDSEILQVVTSANVACGFHAGDPDVMAATMAAAVKNGVGIGAHPGFADLQGFGRRRVSLSDQELGNLVAYQLGAAMAMAGKAGGKVRHLKLHGALANMAAENEAMARVCYEAALAVNPDLVLMVIAQTAQQRAAEALKARYACEIFADRGYEDDATLVDRSKPGAMIHDAEEAAARVLHMIESGAIFSIHGKEIPARIDTICLHGDGPEALAIARSVRAKLEGAGWVLAPL